MKSLELRTLIIVVVYTLDLFILLPYNKFYFKCNISK